jgi:hypothetical protein
MVKLESNLNFHCRTFPHGQSLIKKHGTSFAGHGFHLPKTKLDSFLAQLGMVSSPPIHLRHRRASPSLDDGAQATKWRTSKMKTDMNRYPLVMKHDTSKIIYT